MLWANFKDKTRQESGSLCIHIAASALSTWEGMRKVASKTLNDKFAGLTENTPELVEKVQDFTEVCLFSASFVTSSTVAVLEHWRFFGLKARRLPCCLVLKVTPCVHSGQETANELTSKPSWIYFRARNTHVVTRLIQRQRRKGLLSLRDASSQHFDTRHECSY